MKTYISIPEALKRYPITESEINQLQEAGELHLIQAIVDGGEQQLIYDDDLAAYVADRDICPEKFRHLRGHLLGMNEAAKKYKLHIGTISQWMEQGKLTLRRQDKNKKLVDEADVAYMVTMRKAKKMRPGKKIFS